MELWQMVVADHTNIEELCREVLQATGSGPNSRAELFADLQDELERHFAAQQNVLYPALSEHERTASYLADLEAKQDEILRELDRLAARPDKNSADWAADFKELTGAIRHAFTLEENGVMIVARSAFSPQELKQLWRRYERERIASYEAERWHMPQAMMPSRYGLPTGTVFGALAGLAALGAGALLWTMTRSGHGGSRQSRPLHVPRRHPEPPFPLESGVIDRSLEGSRRRTMAGRPERVSAQGDDALLHGAGGPPPSAGGSPSDDEWFSSSRPRHAPSGLSTPLQPGGTRPAGGAAPAAGALGTSGAQTGGADTGSLKPGGR